MRGAPSGDAFGGCSCERPPNRIAIVGWGSSQSLKILAGVVQWMLTGRKTRTLRGGWEVSLAAAGRSWYGTASERVLYLVNQLDCPIYRPANQREDEHSDGDAPKVQGRFHGLRFVFKPLWRFRRH